jgi:hypothetical protein
MEDRAGAGREANVGVLREQGFPELLQQIIGEALRTVRRRFSRFFSSMALVMRADLRLDCQDVAAWFVADSNA